MLFVHINPSVVSYLFVKAVWEPKFAFILTRSKDEIIPVSGGKFALVAGTVTLPFDLGQTVCPTLYLFLRSLLLH